MAKDCERCAYKSGFAHPKCGTCMVNYHNGVQQDLPSNFKPKPQTHADRIRAMSDEELAKFLATPCECTVNPMADGYRECGNELCIRYLVEWLKQPVGE